MTPGDAIVVRATALADVTVAARVLAQARAADPRGQLPGSGTTLPSAPVDDEGFIEVLAYALKAGHLELATLGGKVTGVACWITHLAKRRPPQPRTAIDQPPAAVLPDLRTRLDVLDAIFEVPDTATHDHLAYLGTPAGYGGRAILELLLGHRARDADRNRRRLYAEVHDPATLRQFGRLGYGWLGISRLDPGDEQATDPPSSALCRPAPTPSSAAPDAELPVQGCGR